MFKLIPFLIEVFCAVALVLAAVGPTIRAFGQELYLLTATPTPQSTARFASTLYRVKASAGTLEKVREVVGYDTGVDFVEADYNLRLIVLGWPPVAPFNFEIVNMDKPASDYSASLPPPNDSLSAVANYLIDLPGRGVGQALRLFGTTLDAAGRPLKGQYTDRLIFTSFGDSANNSEILPRADMLYVRCGGYYGTGVGSDNSLWVRPGSDGMLTGDIRSGLQESLGIPVPPHLSPPLAKYEYLNLWVNNDEMAVIGRGKEPGAVYVFDKTTQTWSRVSNPVGLSMVRGFRSWIAGIAVQDNRNHLRQSPGKEIRKKAQLPTTGRYGLNVEDLFEQSDTYFPGELFLYNAKTGKSYTISTGQGDSEVVLATDSAVYYRVNDTLYRVAVNSDSLGKPELLVKDPVIFQVHWAFLTAAQ